MTNRAASGLLCSLFLLIGGCAITRAPDVVYLPIPAGLTQPCDLPGLPTTTADLSNAFVQAYTCAELGNRDKIRIRELPRTAP